MTFGKSSEMILEVRRFSIDVRESAPVKIRTSNLLIRSQMLYPVELRALKRAVICGGESERQSGAVENVQHPTFNIQRQNQNSFCN